MSGIKVEAGGVFSQTARWAEAGVPFLSPWTPTEPENWQASAISEIPSTWLTLLALLQRSPETLSHPNYGPIQTVNLGFSI